MIVLSVMSWGKVVTQSRGHRTISVPLSHIVMLKGYSPPLSLEVRLLGLLSVTLGKIEELVQMHVWGNSRGVNPAR